MELLIEVQSQASVHYMHHLVAKLHFKFPGVQLGVDLSALQRAMLQSQLLCGESL